VNENAILQTLPPLAIVLVAAILAFDIALRLTPFPAELQRTPPESTEFLDRNGKPLRTLLVEERRFARQCALADISPNLIAATLSAEDRRFRSHCGIDICAVTRAVADAVRHGETTSGASTITQQLVKLARPGPRTVARKLTEMWLALRVERTWSKDRILTEYLNRLDYGNLRTGIASASRYYFAKPPSDLSAAEAAFLAALPKAPTRLDPQTNFSGAKERQRWILVRMRADGRLDRNAFARALNEPTRLRSRARDFEAPHFVDLLLTRRGLAAPNGGEIRTTLDLDLNHFAARALNDNLRRIADKHATAGAVVVIDNPTGDVLALAGSGDYFEAGAGQVNGAWMVRSPGSAVKPFTYLLALEAGAHPGTVVPMCRQISQRPTAFIARTITTIDSTGRLVYASRSAIRSTLRPFAPCNSLGGPKRSIARCAKSALPRWTTPPITTDSASPSATARSDCSNWRTPSPRLAGSVCTARTACCFASVAHSNPRSASSMPKRAICWQTCSPTTPPAPLHSA
jgi:penicillin-binding protein 1C